MAYLKQRRPNFNQEELRALIGGVEKRNLVIETRVGGQVTSRMKREAWEDITKEVNFVSTLHDPRTVEEVQRRYRDYKHRSRKTKGTVRYQPFGLSYEGNDSGGEMSSSGNFLPHHIGCEELTDSVQTGDVKPFLHVINIQSNASNPISLPSSSSRPSPNQTSPDNLHDDNNSNHSTIRPPMMEWMVTLHERLIIAVEQLVEDVCESSTKASADRQRIAVALEGILAHMEKNQKR